jgi:hypothetical protein
MSNKLNLELKQGEDFYRLLTLTDENGAAVNLTGHSFSGQIRSSYASDLFLSFAFTITDAVNGKVEMTIPSATSTAKKCVGKGNFVYDVEHDTGSKKIRIMEGVLLFSPEVTR